MAFLDVSLMNVVKVLTCFSIFQWTEKLFLQLLSWERSAAFFGSVMVIAKMLCLLARGMSYYGADHVTIKVTVLLKNQKRRFF